MDWFEAVDPSAPALPPRARFSSSAGVLPLDGTWGFRYCAEARLAPGPDDPDGFGTITVPGCWQLQGHGSPVYLSAQYPIPLDPPRTPDANPCGDYRLEFDAPEEFLAGAVLRFDGVDSAARVWLNGVLLGETRGSRLTHEFDATAALRPAGNVLLVRVVQWSAGSYLEAQDMWWLSGIFRGVALVARPPDGLADVRVRAGYDGGAGTFGVRAVTASGPAAWSLPELGLTGPADGREVEVGPVDGWTAETPRLYDLVVTAPGETARLRVGFRTVAIVDAVFTVNGRRIRLRGVNRHDHDPRTGRTVTRDAVRRDLLMMKRAHVNAIRTSHYPPTPDLLDLADELGLWVIEEGDIETHGFVLTGWRGNPVDDPAWADAVLDRTRRMVLRDRNHPCVVAWSLGNESGAGRNLAAAYAWAKDADPTRPVHYERDRSYAYSDFFSLMYTPPDRILQIAAGVAAPDDPETDGPLDKPFVLCEFAHAMGAGPGGLAEYEAALDASPRIAGGFVWEWCDHTLALDRGDATVAAYGGDFGEAVHDGNFAADGLVSADRTPHPGLADVAAAYAPFVLSAEGDALVVRSRRDVADASGLELAVTRGGDESRTPLPGVAPGGRARLTLPGCGADEHVAVRVVTTTSSDWAQAGHCLGRLDLMGPDWPVLPSGTGVSLPTFDRLGRLASLGGEPVTGPRLGLWRAPTDNDLGYAMKALGVTPDAEAWQRQNLSALEETTLDVAHERRRLVRTVRVAPQSRDCSVEVVLDWRWESDWVELGVRITPHGEWPGGWARCGLDFGVPGLRGDRSVTWAGRGPWPQWPDTGGGNRWGWFEERVDALAPDYARPQDPGSRPARYLSVEVGGGRRLECAGEGFGFSVHPWPAVHVARAAHPADLPEPAAWTLALDLAQHGVGTGACGPGVLPAYRLSAGAVERRLRLRLNKLSPSTIDAQGVRA